MAFYHHASLAKDLSYPECLLHESCTDLATTTLVGHRACVLGILIITPVSVSSYSVIKIPC